MAAISKSTPELLIEAVEAWHQAELTLEVGEALMERVKAVSHQIEDRVRLAMRQEEMAALGKA